MASEQLESLSPAKRALYEIRALRSRIDESERERTQPIAIVGIGVRLPGAVDTANRFWDLLRTGTSATGPIPETRWPVERYYSPDPDAPGKMIHAMAPLSTIPTCSMPSSSGYRRVRQCTWIPAQGRP